MLSWTATSAWNPRRTPHRHGKNLLLILVGSKIALIFTGEEEGGKSRRRVERLEGTEDDLPPALVSSPASSFPCYGVVLSGKELLAVAALQSLLRGNWRGPSFLSEFAGSSLKHCAGWPETLLAILHSKARAIKKAFDQTFRDL